MNENNIRNSVMKELGGRPDVLIFRNNVGVGFQGKLVGKFDPESITLRFPRRIAFGLHVGSGDLIGMKQITITPDMIGKKVAAFLSVETKSETAPINYEDQINWAKQLKSFGALAGFARSIEDALEIIA